MDAEQAARYWRYALESLEGTRLNTREKLALLDLAMTWEQNSLWFEEIVRISRCRERICLRPATPITSTSEHRIAV